MKNLHKKIGLIALASMVVLGGVAVSGVNSLAYSKQGVSERSLIGYRGFIGDNEEFLEEFDKLIEDVSKKESEAYEKIIEKICKVKKPARKSYLSLSYVGMPFKDEDINRLKNKYDLNEIKGCFKSVQNAVSFVYNNSILHQKNNIVRIKQNGKVYNFIFYVFERR